MKEEALTREDRFHGQYYEALLKELREIKALLKEEDSDEPKRHSTSRRKREQPDCTDPE